MVFSSGSKEAKIIGNPVKIRDYTRSCERVFQVESGLDIRATDWAIRLGRHPSRA